jgi:hypothetical protein
VLVVLRQGTYQVSFSSAQLNDDSTLTINGIKDSSGKLTKISDLLRQNDTPGLSAFEVSDKTGVRTHSVIALGQHIQGGKIVSTSYLVKEIGDSKEIVYRIIAAPKASINYLRGPIIYGNDIFSTIKNVNCFK